jgi:hypothetical protein
VKAVSVFIPMLGIWTMRPEQEILDGFMTIWLAPKEPKKLLKAEDEAPLARPITLWFELQDGGQWMAVAHREDV